MYIDGDIVNNRVFNIQAELGTHIVPNYTYADLDQDNKNDQVNVQWTAVDGAVEYQLEWTFVNSYNDTFTSNAVIPDSPISASLLNYDFKYNSTRITTSSTNYSIPLIFDQGYVIFRLRAVGYAFPNTTDFVYGTWGVNDQ